MNKKMREAIALGKKWAEANKTAQCTACGGSGCYDVAGSPKCGACGGTGRQPAKQTK